MNAMMLIFTMKAHDASIGHGGNDATIGDDTNSPSHLDIFDPNWDGLDSKRIDILLQKGPKRDSYIDHGRKKIIYTVFHIVIR